MTTGHFRVLVTGWWSGRESARVKALLSRFPTPVVPQPGDSMFLRINGQLFTKTVGDDEPWQTAGLFDYSDDEQATS